MKTLSSLQLSQVSGGFSMLDVASSAEDGAMNGATIGTIALVSYTWGAGVNATIGFSAAVLCPVIFGVLGATVVAGAAIGAGCSIVKQFAAGVDQAYFAS